MKRKGPESREIDNMGNALVDNRARSSSTIAGAERNRM